MQGEAAVEPDVPVSRDEAIAVLKSYQAKLSECRTTAARDRLLKTIIEHVAAILAVHPTLERAWLLGMDRINKRFQVSQ